MEELTKYLKALVYLHVNQQSEGPSIKVELLLHRAGLKAKEIAEMIGKKEAAVLKSISRAKGTGSKFNGDE